MMYYVFDENGAFKSKLIFLPVNLKETDILIESEENFLGEIELRNGKIIENKSTYLESSVFIAPNTSEIIEAIAGINDIIVAQQAEIELLKGEKQ